MFTLRARPARFALLALAVLMLATACNSIVNREKVTGSGVMKEETRDLSGFSRIDLRAMGDVEIRLADEESVMLSAEDNLLPLIETYVQNGWLVIEGPDDKNLDPTLSITYTLTARSLSDITLSGSGTITADDIEAESLQTTLSGSGNVFVSGTVERQSVSLTGSGTYDSTAAVGESCTASIAGSGNIFVNVTESLDASILGTGNIVYTEGPTVKQSISGTGNIMPR